MSLIGRSARFHFNSHWSSQSNFWIGITGMLVNNSLTLLGIWAMLFAGKASLIEARDTFFIMNSVLMLAWGVIHVFLGGVANLDTQINQGSLDLAMVTPRSPFLTLSLTSSDLPAWGDVILGGLGLVIFSFHSGFLFFLHSLVMVFFACVSLYSFFLFSGSLAFWFRRTENAHAVLINMCLAFNTYPIFGGSESGSRWAIFLTPILLAGVIPASFLVQPTLELLALEVIGSLVVLFAAKKFFYLGMKRYQSCSILGLQR
jgi:ABC-type uncharacterized transport system permease subunit